MWTGVLVCFTAALGEHRRKPGSEKPHKQGGCKCRLGGDFREAKLAASDTDPRQSFTFYVPFTRDNPSHYFDVKLNVPCFTDTWSAESSADKKKAI